MYICIYVYMYICICILSMQAKSWSSWCHAEAPSMSLIVPCFELQDESNSAAVAELCWIDKVNAGLWAGALDSCICCIIHSKSDTNVENLYDRAKEWLNQAIHGYSMFLIVVLLCLEEVRKLGWMYWSQTQHGSRSGDVEIVQVFYSIPPSSSIFCITPQYKTSIWINLCCLLKLVSASKYGKDCTEAQANVEPKVQRVLSKVPRGRNCWASESSERFLHFSSFVPIGKSE